MQPYTVKIHRPPRHATRHTGWAAHGRASDVPRTCHAPRRMQSPPYSTAVGAMLATRALGNPCEFVSAQLTGRVAGRVAGR